jgi:hypothetical protein
MTDPRYTTIARRCIEAALTSIISARASVKCARRCFGHVHLTHGRARSIYLEAHRPIASSVPILFSSSAALISCREHYVGTFLLQVGPLATSEATRRPSVAARSMRVDTRRTFVVCENTFVTARRNTSHARSKCVRCPGINVKTLTIFVHARAIHSAGRAILSAASGLCIPSRTFRSTGRPTIPNSPPLLWGSRCSDMAPCSNVVAFAASSGDASIPAESDTALFLTYCCLSL